MAAPQDQVPAVAALQRKTMEKNALLLFQKNADAGKVKTRLARSIGDEKALAIYLHLVAYTYTQADPVPCKKHIYFSERLEILQTPLTNSTCHIQTGVDLGERIKNAFREAFENKYERVIIIGTDCPELKTTHLTDAFGALETHDLVIGPALDGGYYLLGMRTFTPELFDNITWSTSGVFEQTKNTALQLGKTISLLEKLSDVDEVSDLPESVKILFHIV